MRPLETAQPSGEVLNRLGEKYALNLTTRWQYITIDDNGDGLSGSIGTSEAVYIFHLENCAWRWCVRACICVWVRVRVRVLSYLKPLSWKIYFVGTQPVLTRMYCPKLSCLVNWLFDLIKVSKSQFSQICAVPMMQRILCWLSQGLVHLNLKPSACGLESCEMDIWELCQRFVKLMCSQIACLWRLDPQSGLVSLHILCLVELALKTDKALVHQFSKNSDITWNICKWLIDGWY